MSARKKTTAAPSAPRAHSSSAALKPQEPARVGRLIAFSVFIFAITFISFLPSLKNGFVGWDDSGMFLENVDYRGLKWENIKWMFSTFHYAHYHPITWLTLGLDYELYKLDATGYHRTSLIIHSFNAVFFFFLIRTILRRTVTAQTTVMDLAAAVGALVFAIHPLRVESVAWATERRDVLSGFFYLLTLIAYLRAQTQTQHRTRWLIAALVCFLLSFLSKAWGITLPVVLLILDVYPLRRISWPLQRTKELTSVLVEKIPFVVVSATLAVVAYMGQQKWGIESESLTLLKKLAISAYALCFYLWKTIVPINLSPLYLLPPDLDPFAPLYLGCAFVAVAVTALLVAFRRRWPWALAAWLCYAVIVSPVIGLTHKGDQIAADRYTYLCLLPVGVLVAAGLLRLLQRNATAPRAFATLVAIIILGGLSFLTFEQTKIWKDDLALWQQALKVEPHNSIAYNGRGRILMERGELQPALADFNRALELNPKLVSARNNRGMVQYNLGDLDAALADFQAALKIHPQHEMFNNCGAIYEVRGNLPAAIEQYSLAIKLKPSYAIAYFNRARVLKRQGNHVAALTDFNTAAKFDPFYADTYYRRGDLYLEMGNKPAAMKDYQTAVQVAPETWSYRADATQKLQAASAQ